MFWKLGLGLVLGLGLDSGLDFLEYFTEKNENVHLIFREFSH